MGNVVFDISMSLDGFITGANPRPEAGWGGLGEGGEQLHEWGFNMDDPRDRAIIEWYARIFLVEPGMTIPYLTGEQMDQAALPGYQRSSFRTVCPRTYRMVVSTSLSMAWKPRSKQRSIWQAIRISI